MCNVLITPNQYQNRTRTRWKTKAKGKNWKTEHKMAAGASASSVVFMGAEKIRVSKLSDHVRERIKTVNWQRC